MLLERLAAATDPAAENTPPVTLLAAAGPAPGSHAAPDDVACSHRWFHPTPRGVAGSEPSPAARARAGAIRNLA